MVDLGSPRVLIIDDDRQFLGTARAHLERAGIRIEVSADPRDGVRTAIEQDFDLILLDLVMPEMGGEEVLGLLKSLSIQRPVVIVSAEGSEVYRARARNLGAAAYLEKPVDAGELRRIIDGQIRGGRPEMAESAVAPARGPTDRLAHWVFGPGEVTFLKRLAAAGVAAGLSGVLAWLIWA